MCLVRDWGVISCMILHAYLDQEGGVLAVVESKKEVGANCKENKEK